VGILFDAQPSAQSGERFGVADVAQGDGDVAEKSTPFGAENRAAAEAAAEFLICQRDEIPWERVTYLDTTGAFL